MKNSQSGLPAPAGLALGVTLLFAAPDQAWAYVDPGAGSYAFQLAAGALLAGTYLVRRWAGTVIEWSSALFGRHPATGMAARNDGRRSDAAQ